MITNDNFFFANPGSTTVIMPQTLNSKWQNEQHINSFSFRCNGKEKYLNKVPITAKAVYPSMGSKSEWSIKVTKQGRVAQSRVKLTQG